MILSLVPLYFDFSRDEEDVNSYQAIRHETWLKWTILGNLMLEVTISMTIKKYLLNITIVSNGY